MSHISGADLAEGSRLPSLARQTGISIAQLSTLFTAGLHLLRHSHGPLPRSLRAEQARGCIGRGVPRLHMEPGAAPAPYEHPRSAFKSSGSPVRSALRTPLRQVRRNTPSAPAARPNAAAACGAGALAQGSTPPTCSDTAVPGREARAGQPAEHASPILHSRGSTDSDISLKSLARNAGQVLASLANGVRHKLCLGWPQHFTSL